jgi:hypothetical protein
MKWLSPCAVALTIWGCASAEQSTQGLRADANGGGGGDPMDAPDGTGSGSGSGSGSGMGSGSGSGSGSMGTCNSTPSDLLVNGNFDSMPAGTGWTAMPIDPAGPIVGTDPGVATPQSPTMYAFLAGYPQAKSDSIYQDIAIPANATTLQITGFYAVKTNELGATAYDTSKVEIVTTGGTVLEPILSTQNKNVGWTALDKTIGNLAGMKGQTVRLRMTSTSDDSYATGFGYDTLKLLVTCQ